MTTYKCVTHDVTLEINGNQRRVRYTKSVPNLPNACTLLLMKTPQVLAIGQLYTSPVTGRSAYNQCQIEEEATV